MASSPPPEDNPFIAFRRFADAQFAALLQNMLPDADAAHWPHDHPGASNWADATSPTSPTSPPAATLHDYLARSPYSPFALEQDPNLQAHRPWRVAFAELLVVPPADAAAPASSTSPRHCPRVEAAAEPRTELDLYEGQSCRRRGRGADRWCKARAERQQAEAAAAEERRIEAAQQLRAERATERETRAMEREARMRGGPWEMLRRGDERTGWRGQATHAQTQTQPQTQPQTQTQTPRDSVVATVTTTEAVVLPDGSTRTTVARKRTFADGREERRESVHVGPTGRDAGSGVMEMLGRNGREGALKEGQGAPKKGGWFWAS